MNARSNRTQWSAQALNHADQFVPESEAAQQAREDAVTMGVTPISQGTAAALTVLAKAVGAKAVVEIGSGTGVSGLALFAGMVGDGILTSVDVEAEHQAAARRAFVATGIRPQRFRLIAGAALNVLPRLSDGAYDLVFIDADKLEYVEYVAQAIRLLRHGGILVLDNAAWKGKVADPANEEDETLVIREALDAVKDSEDLSAALLPVGDGLLVAVKS